MSDSHELTQQGIAALKAGQRASAAKLLYQATQQDPDNQTAWLWLSGLAENADARRDCLERVIAINPDNDAGQRAARGLALLRKEHTAAPPPAASSQPVAPPQPPKVSPPQPAARARPNIGGAPPEPDRSLMLNPRLLIIIGAVAVVVLLFVVGGVVVLLTGGGKPEPTPTAIPIIAAAPTRRPSPTTAMTPTRRPVPTNTVGPPPTLTPTPAPSAFLSISSNGSIYAEPQAVSSSVVGQVCAGDTVGLLETSGEWRQVRVERSASECVINRAPVGTEGWVRASLIAAQTGPPPTAAPAVPQTEADQQRADYVREVNSVRRDLETEIGQFRMLIQPPINVNDPAWLNAMGQVMRNIQGIHAYYTRMNVPDGMQVYHDSLLATTQNCSNAMDHFAAGINNANQTEVNEGNRLLESCQTSLNALEAAQP